MINLKTFWVLCILVSSYNCFFCYALYASELTARGIVYLDNNKNGQKENNEIGLGDIAISNGRNIVKTDNNGNYSISIKSGDILFLIKPSGYQITTNQLFPSFYYVYNPKGSINLKYTGVRPTGDLPNTIDFGLVKQHEPNDFKIMVFGDPQLLGDKDLDYFNRGIIDDVLKSNHNIAFGITMGDVTYDNLNVIPKYIEKMTRIGVPWYHTGGNHDINFDAASDEYAHETYKSHFGPLVYSFDYANVHFIVLNNVIYKGGSYEQKGDYQGGIRKRHFEFIENDLKYVPTDKLVVLISHIPYVGREGNPTIRKNDLDQLFTLLKDYKHTFSIAAHTHMQGQRFVKAPYFKNTEYEYHHQYNVGTTSGNLYSGVLDNLGIPPAMMADGTPKGYAIINFNNTRYTIDYKVAGQPKTKKLHIHTPKVLLKHEKTRASFYVNYYLGSELDTVKYRINNSEWKDLTRVLEYDPLYLQQIYEWDNSETLLNGKRPSPPSLSSHLWKGIIFGEGEVGAQRLEVMVKDMFGRTFTDSTSFELVAN